MVVVWWFSDGLMEFHGIYHLVIEDSYRMLWTDPPFLMRKTHFVEWPCSIAMLNYQRLNPLKDNYTSTPGVIVFKPIPQFESNRLGLGVQTSVLFWFLRVLMFLFWGKRWRWTHHRIPMARSLPDDTSTGPWSSWAAKPWTRLSGFTCHGREYVTRGKSQVFHGISESFSGCWWLWKAT